MDGWRLIDRARTVCLCEVGNTTYLATVAVDRQGNESYWLAHKHLLGDHDVDHGDEHPAHERTGQLPQAVQDRIWPRCGRPNKHGQPCRQVVAERGQACCFHTEHR